MHAFSVIAWDTSERTVPSTSAPCVSIGPWATLKCIAHFAVALPCQPLPPPLPLLSAIPLPPSSLVQYLLHKQEDPPAIKLCISHLTSTLAEDEATILRTLRNAEAPPDPIPQRRSMMAPPRPTSPDPPEENTETIKWSFFGDSDLVQGYCYDLPLTTLSHFYDNFSFHASSSCDSTYVSL